MNKFSISSGQEFHVGHRAIGKVRSRPCRRDEGEDSQRTGVKILLNIRLQFLEKMYSCHENNRLLSDGYKGQVFDKPCFHKSLCKKRPTDDSRCHVLPLTENNLCLVVFNLSIFSRIAKIRIFWREIGTAALKPQKLTVCCSQDFNIVEHTMINCSRILPSLYSCSLPAVN